MSDQPKGLFLTRSIIMTIVNSFPLRSLFNFTYLPTCSQLSSVILILRCLWSAFLPNFKFCTVLENVYRQRPMVTQHFYQTLSLDCTVLKSLYPQTDIHGPKTWIIFVLFLDSGDPKTDISTERKLDMEKLNDYNSFH